jgi:hypothetical protein
LEEVLASKLTTLLHRRNPADLFDLIYAIVFRDQFGVNRREVITTFLRKSIFEQEPIAAREQLRAVPIADFRGLWKSIVAPVASIFALVVIPQPALPTATPAMTSRIRRPSGTFGGLPGSGFRNYFSSEIRNTIIGAGRSRVTVQLAYDGVVRIVEPYKLEYYVRKKDGRGLEYFWGWDTSGGKSGKVGVKQFICDKIQSVHPTTQSFQPRYTVEL